MMVGGMSDLNKRDGNGNRELSFRFVEDGLATGSWMLSGGEAGHSPVGQFLITDPDHSKTLYVNALPLEPRSCIPEPVR
jgi:hypothetical protein